MVPPINGMVMGRIISLPTPVAQRMGIKPKRPTEPDISNGRNQYAEPSITNSLMIAGVSVAFEFPCLATILFIASFK